MLTTLKIRNVPIEIEFEMYDGELDDWKVVKVADSENEDLLEYFYNLIEITYAKEVEWECLKTIETCNEEIKIERYLDAIPR